MPADDAGIRGAWRNQRGEIVLGDIITAIDDKTINSNDDYLSYMESKRPGDQVLIKTSLNGQEKQYLLELAEPQ